MIVLRIVLLLALCAVMSSVATPAAKLPQGFIETKLSSAIRNEATPRGDATFIKSLSGATTQQQASGFTIASNPSGINFLVDGAMLSAPSQIAGEAGTTREVTMPESQIIGGNNFVFVGWTDGSKSRFRQITATTNATTYTALYELYSHRTYGLSATYFDNENFTGITSTRTDAVIDFDFTNNQPAPNIGSQAFSARWIGYLVVPQTDLYTFYIQSNSGVSLTIVNEFGINALGNTSPAEYSGQAPLIAGKLYRVQVDFSTTLASSYVRLLWSSSSRPKEILPTVNFSPVKRRLKSPRLR